MGKHDALVDYWRQRAQIAEARVALLMGLLQVKEPGDFTQLTATRPLDAEKTADARSY